MAEYFKMNVDQHQSLSAFAAQISVFYDLLGEESKEPGEVRKFRAAQLSEMFNYWGEQLAALLESLGHGWDEEDEEEGDVEARAFRALDALADGGAGPQCGGNVVAFPRTGWGKGA